jgi:hypothetical protein
MSIKSLQTNTELVRNILSKSKNEEEMHKSLDSLLNSVNIFYKSKKDFADNFPDSDDLRGKVNLFITRSK